MLGLIPLSGGPLSSLPSAQGAQTLTPALFTNTQTFYDPTITQTGGTQTLTPDLYTNTQTFYAPTVTTTVTLTPDLYTNAQTFYAATVTQTGGTQTLLPDLYVNTQTFFAPTITGGADAYLRGEGWIPQVKRKRKFSEERDERDQLRKAIEQAVDPVTEKEAKVVTVKGEVAVVTESQAIPIPVPPQFDAQAVARMVVSVLETRQIETQRVRDAQNRRRALLALEAQRVENERRLRKRRRDEEILLLM